MRERIDVWSQAFNGDDNAIAPALVTFTWNYLAFMSVARMIEAAPVGESGKGRQLNSLMLGLLRDSYWGSAILAIRRLLDRGKLDGPRGVFSLRAVIEDVRACRDSLTRRVYVEDIAGLEYNYEPVEQRSLEYLRSKGPGPVWMPQDLDSHSIRVRHEEFDYLSGVSENGRSEYDLVQPSIFERLEDRLSRLDRVAEHATIYIAHAATTASRAGRGLEKWGTEDAKEALQLLTETAELVGRWFIGSGVGDVLPCPQYDQFAYLDRPMASGEVVDELRQQWDDFAAETARWPMIGDREL